MRRLVGVPVALVFAAFAGLGAEERTDEAMLWKIRQEATARSQILQTLHVLTDVYGPRPTGSPNLKAAGEWAVQQMTSWGMKNAHLEPWDWNHPGWMPERASGFITSPVKANLKFEIVPWSPSTKGTVTGTVLAMKVPENPTEA